MTEATTFDTHKFVKDLTQHGFTEEQAEVLANRQVELLNSNLATKADIEKLRLTTKADIEQLRLTTKADIEKLRLSTKADIEQLRQSTKADIEELRQSTKADIEELRLSTKADIATIKVSIAETESKLLRWMIGAMIAQTGLIVTLVKIL